MYKTLTAFFAVMLAFGSTPGNARHDPTKCFYPRIEDLPDAPPPVFFYEKSKVWASLVLEVGQGGLERVYYMVFWDDVREEYREIVSFQYADPYLRKFFVRTLGKKIDTRLLCDGEVEEDITDPQADNLMNAVKGHLRAEERLQALVRKNRPRAWPTVWPPVQS